jgi:WD40 repeat protein/serine/threonine protein kinase
MAAPNPSPSARERDIFLEALDQSTPEARAAFLERACGNDHSLRRAVNALLQNHKVDNFLEAPAIDTPRAEAARLGVRPPPVGAALVEKAGDRIGRYKLLQDIGEGACGIVYMADQEEPVRRRVALKIIKPGMDTKTVIARFEAERQALALMDHPNIAKVLDAGTTGTGRPFFVMELVRGIKITDYCDQNNLSTRERLDLFIRVCQAIQHAHQKGIIHRDIKPSNLLVTLHDGVPVPKVIDFGIAKATEQRLTDKTLFTAFEQFIGTPAYMSPEQAEMSGLDIDTRTDIYSLGVLLYEMLTGKTPLDGKELAASGLDAMRRTIREQEPLKPSTRLTVEMSSSIDGPLGVPALAGGVGGEFKSVGTSEAPPARSGTSYARQRSTHATRQLISLIRGDLDWIVMKALEKDRSRRYATANELATDIQRYLNNEPVIARPPSAAYKIQKFVRRNKVMVVSAGAIAAILVMAVGATSWQAFRATHAEHEQSRLRKAAEEAQQSEATQRLRAETEEFAALRRSYNSDMNLVQQALAANNYGRVVELLDRQRPVEKSQISDLKSQIPTDFRQWEWRYFWNQSRSEAAFALPQQSNSITGLALSPNGRLLVSSDRKGLVKLWDLTTRSEVAVIREQGFGPSAFAFSRDGGRLAAAVNSGPRETLVKVWTVATREVTAEFTHDGGVEALIFSPDDTKLLALGHDLAIRTWDVQTQKLVLRKPGQRMEGRGRKVTAFSWDGSLIASASAQPGQPGRIRVVDSASGATKVNIDTSVGEIASLAFSQDGEVLAVSPLFFAATTDIMLFSTTTGKELGPLVGHVSWVPGTAFMPDGTRLVSAGADQTIRIWDVGERREFATLRGHLSEINCVAITSDGKTIISGCKDGTLFGWDAERIKQKRQFETLPIPVGSVEFFSDSQGMLAVNRRDGTVNLWNTANLKEIEPVAVLGRGITRVLISPDRSRLFAGTRQGEIKVVDWATRLVITNVAGPRGDAIPLGFIDGGRTVVTVGGDSSIRLLDTVSWEAKTVAKSNDGPFPWRPRMVLFPEKRFVLMAGRDGAIDFLNLQDGQTESIPSGHSWGINGMAFSPDGQLFATSSGEGMVNLVDVETRQVVDTLRGHLLGVHAVAFSADGQRLASISHGNEAVKLWDVATRHEVATLAGEGTIFDFVKFSPDGKLLVAINAQGMLHLWRAPSLKDIAAAELRQARSPQRR